MNYSQLLFHSSSRENCKHPFNGGDILNSSYFVPCVVPCLYLYYNIFALIPVELNTFKCLKMNLFTD